MSLLPALSSTEDPGIPLPGPRLRVLLADHSGDVRGLLRSALEATGAVTVVGEAPDGATAVRLAEQLRPGAVVSDLRLPVVRGDAALRAMRDALPHSVLVLCSPEPDTEAVQESLADVVVDRCEVGWVEHLSDRLLLSARSAGPPEWPRWERRQRSR